MLFYEPYIKKKKRPRRERVAFGPWLLRGLVKLLAALLALAVVALGLLYALPVALFQVEPEDVELSLTDGLPASRANILLLGTDLLRDSSQRSDTMIIASVGYNRLNLTSVLRDTLVDIPGRGTDKLNAAYAYGGPELTMRTLNANLGLNIMHYVAVDFVALVEVVDALGGVNVSITEAEMAQINKNVYTARKVFIPLGYTAQELTTWGENTHLNGLQALGFARIRKIDSDFTRASRQRALLTAMLKKLRGSLWNPVVLTRLAKAVARSVRTNLPTVALLSLGAKALIAGTPGQLRLPVEGSYTDDGSALHIDDAAANAAAFMEFAYN